MEMPDVPLAEAPVPCALTNDLVWVALKTVILICAIILLLICWRTKIYNANGNKVLYKTLHMHTRTSLCCRTSSRLLKYMLSLFWYRCFQHNYSESYSIFYSQSKRLSWKSCDVLTLKTLNMHAQIQFRLDCETCIVIYHIAASVCWLDIINICIV